MFSSASREAQRLVACTSRCRTRLCQDISRRLLSTSSLGSQGPPSLPWFVDPAENETSAPSSYAHRVTLPHAPPRPVAPLPSAIPPGHPIARLHAELKASPHLEPGTLLVREPVPTAVGPPLPETMPKGRRRRGRTYLGEGVPTDVGGIWDWLVIAQVKEGTESRGGIESVIRTVRKALLTLEPPVLLPPNNKRKTSGGWAMIDAGDFAVHILSQETREKYFPERRDW